MSKKQQRVHVGIVTYRRVALLKRALDSVQSQSYDNWQCFVINDDPEDPGPARLIDALDDPRITLYQPNRKRGAAGSFNEAFRFDSCDFLSLLEDDNWWNSDFLETMIAALDEHPEVTVACGNERIWKEQEDGNWIDTGRDVWSIENDVLYEATMQSACGSAKICNSSMLVRRAGGGPWLTPENIPVDVTEHFRERVFPWPILLVSKVLVNYAETLQTHRDTSGGRWSDYQILLIGSVFASSPKEAREQLARSLLAGDSGRPSPHVTKLLATGLACREARIIWCVASYRQRLRYVVTLIRRWRSIGRVFSVKRRLRVHWEWLLKSPFNQSIYERAANITETEKVDSEL